MRDKATCFFCYSWDNLDMYELLSYLKDEIEDRTKGRISVILDKRNYQYNDDFDEKLKKMWEYDVIVSFFSPEFKLTVTNKSQNHRELFKEYEVIKERFEIDTNSIFPIILKGTKENALMSPFLRKNSPNLSDFGIKLEQDEIHYPKNKEKEFEKIILDLIGQTMYNYYNKSIDYKNAFQAVENLFWLTDVTELPTKCLVKMDIYSKIISQRYYFVAGRKGSGKSTFLNNFKRIDPEYFKNSYKRMIPISAENFNHDFLYEELIKKNYVDRNIIQPKELLSIFWQVYITIQSVYIIGIELEEGRITDERRKMIFERTVNKLKELLGLKYYNGKYRTLLADGVPKFLFMLAASALNDQYNIAIDKATSKNTYSSFLGHMDAVCILENLFGIEILEEFMDELERCTKKIIIGLDGFDTNSEDFRKCTESMLYSNPEEHSKRMQYEIYFFRTLIEVVTKFENSTFSDPIMSALQEYLDFCIVLPKDRYDQIIKNDRDSAKKKFCSLVWDAYELLELIVFRLEYLISKINGNTCFPSTDDIFVRFQNAIDYFPGIPKMVTIDVDGHNKQMSLFNYILRYSFWRPRDVISNFSAILAYVINENRNGEIEIINHSKILDNALLKYTIKSNTRTIIDKEMFSEYENVFRNLEIVLDKFMGSDLIVEMDDFCEKLSKIRFDASYAYNLDKIESKLYVLYELGLIGLYFDKAVVKLTGYSHYTCFVFNEGLQPIIDCNKRRRHENYRAKVIFNPILCENLCLRINTSELICDWDPEYIMRLHQMKAYKHSV